MLERKRWRDLVKPGAWHHLAIILFLPGRPVRLHTHDFPEIFWIERGEGRHHINGQVKRLRAGDLVFVRPEDRHWLEAVDARGFTLVNLAYHPRARLELLRRFRPEFAPLLAPEELLPCRAELAAPTLAALRGQLAGLKRVSSSRLNLEHFLLGLPAQIRPVTEELPAMPDWLRRACEELRRPEVFAQGARGFAKVSGRSAEHVARTVRQVFNLTPSDYVNRIRMEHAARELRVTTRPIADIALDCGVGNLSHFYVLFRQAHGRTPRAYRQENYRSVT